MPITRNRRSQRKFKGQKGKTRYVRPTDKGDVTSTRVRTFGGKTIIGVRGGARTLSKGRRGGVFVDKTGRIIKDPGALTTTRQTLTIPLGSGKNGRTGPKVKRVVSKLELLKAKNEAERRRLQREASMRLRQSAFDRTTPLNISQRDLILSQVAVGAALSQNEKARRARVAAAQKARDREARRLSKEFEKSYQRFASQEKFSDRLKTSPQFLKDFFGARGTRLIEGLATTGEDVYTFARVTPINQVPGALASGVIQTFGTQEGRSMFWRNLKRDPETNLALFMLGGKAFGAAGRVGGRLVPAPIRVGANTVRGFIGRSVGKGIRVVVSPVVKGGRAGLRMVGYAVKKGGKWRLVNVVRGAKIRAASIRAAQRARVVPSKAARAKLSVQKVPEPPAPQGFSAYGQTKLTQGVRVTQEIVQGGFYKQVKGIIQPGYISLADRKFLGAALKLLRNAPGSAAEAKRRAIINALAKGRVTGRIDINIGFAEPFKAAVKTGAKQSTSYFIKSVGKKGQVSVSKFKTPSVSSVKRTVKSVGRKAGPRFDRPGLMAVGKAVSRGAGKVPRIVGSGKPIVFSALGGAATVVGAEAIRAQARKPRAIVDVAAARDVGRLPKTIPQIGAKPLTDITPKGDQDSLRQQITNIINIPKDALVDLITNAGKIIVPAVVAAALLKAALGGRTAWTSSGVGGGGYLSAGGQIFFGRRGRPTQTLFGKITGRGGPTSRFSTGAELVR